MLAHTIVSGLIPKDGAEVQKALDEMSAAGFSLLSTTCCAIDEANAYYIATFGKPVVAPANLRSGIGMGGGGPRPRTEPQNVDASTAAQSKDS